jgi:uncharacterized protein (TIGR03086 family)
MDPTDLLARSYDALQQLVDSLDADDFEKQTPCEEWKVRDALDHVVGGMGRFTATVRDGAPLSGADPDEDHLGADPAASLRAAAADNLDAWRSTPGAAEKPTGMLPGVDVIDINLGDTVLHTWDIATAVGRDPGLDAEAVQRLLVKMRNGWAEAGHEMGAFGPPCPVPDGASPVDELVALTGRSA